MTHTSRSTPSGGTPLVVPRLEPIDEESGAVAPAAAPPKQRAKTTDRTAASAAHSHENPFTKPVPPLAPGSDEPDWPTRHPPSRYSLVLPAATPVTSLGVSSELNYRGHVALGLGLASLALVVIMWATDGGGVWWANVGFGGFAVWSGIRDQNAVNRGLASNPWQARLGLLAGLLGIVGTVAYLVSAMMKVATLVT